MAFTIDPLRAPLLCPPSLPARSVTCEEQLRPAAEPEVGDLVVRWSQMQTGAVEERSGGKLLAVPSAVAAAIEKLLARSSGRDLSDVRFLSPVADQHGA